MIGRKHIATIGGTALCALGIGFFMQMGGQSGTSGDMPEAVRQATAQAPVAKSGFSPLDAPGAMASRVADSLVDAPALSLADIMPQALPDVPLPDHVVVAALDQTGDQLPNLPAESAPALTCTVDADAVAEAGAMVRLDVSAPCLAEERVVIHHSGMMFSDITDAEGGLDILIPALSQNAVFIVEFANGEGAVATAEVASLASYDRVVLQWAGDLGLQVHAREFGADYDAEGHVWAGSSRDLTVAARGDGGFLTTLGRSDALAPLMAQVYTFPTATATRAGIIDLTVEAEVTAANCGREVEAQSLEVQADGRLRTRDLALTMPGCDASGDFLVLNNLMDDLKIAAR
ncbi:MAG: hypothetical protein EP307_03570 [Rhodobacteraceae bacterium]|nr:MAG: hypothetical protein EP307_03570 [Paracoccaceae bacterium]